MIKISKINNKQQKYIEIDLINKFKSVHLAYIPQNLCELTYYTLSHFKFEWKLVLILRKVTYGLWSYNKKTGLTQVTTKL